MGIVGPDDIATGSTEIRVPMAQRAVSLGAHCSCIHFYSTKAPALPRLNSCVNLPGPKKAPREVVKDFSPL